MKKKGTPSFQAQGSPLLEGLRLAMVKQSKRKFSGKSEDDMVRVRVNGQHQIESLEIENSGLSKKREEALVFAIKEAMTAAIEKAQRAARKDIVAGTKGENRSKKKDQKP